MKTLTLAGMELRRFLRGHLPRAAVVALAVIPLLYGALYLYAFWDPYGHLNHVPAALVMQDRTATATDGTTVHAGPDLAGELLQRKVFDWHVTDEKTAEKHLTDGDYQVILRIPADFSADLAGAPDPDADPSAGRLTVVTDDATNYLTGVFARTVFDEVRSAAASQASATYFDKMLVGFTDLKQQTEQAADGAGKLDSGASQAQDGAGQLETGIDDARRGAGKLAGGLGDARSGANRLSAGLGTARTGADDLATGLTQLNAGAAQLATGTAQAAAGGQQLATTVDAAADRVGPLLRDNAQLIAQAADQVAAGADALAANLGRLDGDADRLVTLAGRLRDQTEPGSAARQLADQLVSTAQALRDTLPGTDLDALAARLREVAATAREVAAAAPHLADDIAAARARVDQLATGLNQLATGAQHLRTGTAAAKSGATDLSGGIAQLQSGAGALEGGLYQLSTGARQLDGGLSALSGGGRQLVDGLGDLQNGAAKLASGLSDGADQIPGYGDDPSARAGVLADPVSVDRSVRHPAGTYGVGFAPYFLALALWVGAMIVFLVLRPLNRTYLVSGAPRLRVALAGFLPAAAIGVVQASLLYAVVTLALGLSPVHGFATWGLLVLAALGFAAIMQLLGAALGPAGRIVALVLLMLQLTSSGGTYPVQTTPWFFQAIHPLLPMTYVVEALRHTIDGGPAGTVTTGVLALLAYGLGALALTVLVAHRSRRMTPSGLHPELVI